MRENSAAVRASAVGGVVLALVTIFGFMNGVPWERRGAAAEVKADYQHEMVELRATYLRDVAEIKADIREIRDRVRRVP